MTHHGNIVTFVGYLIWTKNTYTSDITCEVVKTLSAVFKASPLEWRLTGCSFMVSCCLFFLLWKTEDIFKKDDCVFSNNSIRMRTNSIKRRTGGERELTDILWLKNLIYYNPLWNGIIHSKFAPVFVTIHKSCLSQKILHCINNMYSY